MSRPGYQQVNINNHWSLLVHFKSKGMFYHYDSISGFNSRRCDKVTHNLVRFGVVEPQTESSAITIRREVEYFPQQSSHWECGYYGIWAIKCIISKNVLGPLSYTDCWKLSNETHSGLQIPKVNSHTCVLLNQLHFPNGLVKELKHKTEKLYITEECSKEEQDDITSIE